MLILTIALLAHATPLSEQPRFQEAVAAYENLDFETSLLRMQRLNLGDVNESDRSRVWIWMGVLYGQTGDNIGAQRSFAHGLEIDPEQVLPAKVPPILQSLFDKEKQRAQEDKVAREQEQERIEKERIEKERIENEKRLRELEGKQRSVTVIGASSLMVAGAVALASSAGFGLYANSQWTVASDSAQSPKSSNDALVATNRSLAASGALALLGGLMVAGGLGFLFLSPKE